MPPTKTWKKKEAQGASELNPGVGRRTPLSGSNSGHNTSSDCIYMNGLYVEAKHRKSHSVLKLLKETIDQAKAEFKIPVVRLTQHMMRGAAYLIHSHHLDDFIKTASVNRGISPFESKCHMCDSRAFTESIETCVSRGEEDKSGYLVRRCADCGFPIRYSHRSIDPVTDKQKSLFPRGNELPDFSNKK